VTWMPLLPAAALSGVRTGLSIVIAIAKPI